jgi:cellulose synthase/poly-beta-1,6-N-acetylglucosamine synthase-like glycosyltransferase
MKIYSSESLPKIYSEFEIPISVLMPAHNEEKTIADSVRAMFQLIYSQYEVVVINDGSTDNTLEVLIKEFSLVPFSEAYRVRLKTKPIKTIFRSTIYPNLRVIDKENGGKSDALNAGINCARYSLYCGVDADSLLQRDSLQKIVRPFLEDPEIVACGGTVRVANGCDVTAGYLAKTGVGIPKNFWALCQIVEYLRAFLFGRFGWAPLNALLIISGAFGLFHKETVIAVGGYRTDTIGEDMELIVRLHRKLRLGGKKYKITFVPDPICWTEVPEDLKTLKNQRIRWQRGLSESLMKNSELFFNDKGGTVSWLAFPFTTIFEWFGPLIEVSGYIFTIVTLALGLISLQAMLTFFFVSIGLGVLLSINALLLEEMSFHLYPRPKQLATLFLVSIAENFGYRQINSYWRLVGLFKWAFGKTIKWGEMKRTAKWIRPKEIIKSATVEQSSV